MSSILSLFQVGDNGSLHLQYNSWYSSNKIIFISLLVFERSFRPCFDIFHSQPYIPWQAVRRRMSLFSWHVCLVLNDLPIPSPGDFWPHLLSSPMWVEHISGHAMFSKHSLGESDRHVHRQLSIRYPNVWRITRNVKFPLNPVMTFASCACTRQKRLHQKY